MFGSTRDRNVNKFNNTVYIFFIIHNNVSHIICSITILYTAVFFQSYINVYLILESVIFNVTEYVLSKNEDFWSIFFFCCVSKKKERIKTRLKICNNNKNFKLRNIFSDSLLYKTFLLAHSGFIMC